MSISIHLLVHPLCPFAQRALLVSSFKNLNIQITEVSLAHPPSLLTEMNPLGEVPSCSVTRNNQTFYLTESLNICEYFDSLPGPALYPRCEDGKIDSLIKCSIDIFIKTRLGEMVTVYYQGIVPEIVAEDVQKEVERILKPLNEAVEGGKFIGFKLFGKDELSFADVMMFTHIIWLESNIHSHEYLEKIDLSDLWKWYRRMREFEWVQRHQISTQRYLNLVRIGRSGNDHGLDLPLTIYD